MRVNCITPLAQIDEEVPWGPQIHPSSNRWSWLIVEDDSGAKDPRIQDIERSKQGVGSGSRDVSMEETDGERCFR